jgi:hypothetical protein
MSKGFSVASKVSLRLGKGLNLKLLLYARPGFSTLPCTRELRGRAISTGSQMVRGTVCSHGCCLYTAPMAVSVEMQHTGCEPGMRAEIAAIIEHALADRPGDWRVLIIGSQANDRWEMKIAGPNGFERSYTLDGSAGEHEPQVIGKLVARMVPGRSS